MLSFPPYSIQLISASYLDTPRIYFFGNFRADISTVNNVNCNFDLDLNYLNDTNEDFNAVGTGEFSFLNAEVYGAVGKDGTFTENDPVIGAKVFDNGKRPFAKLVDLDVDVQSTFSTVFGMKFGIGWDQIEEGKENLAFKGYWTRNIISPNNWFRVKCYDELFMTQHTTPRGVTATTTIVDISWDADNDRNSTVLKNLREASMENGNTLQVSTTFYFYTRHYDPYVPSNFSLGYVVGVIGIYKKGEPLNYGGERLLGPNDISRVNNSVCGNENLYGFENSPWWMFKSNFKVSDSRTLTVDLSNSLPLTMNSTMYDIGPLFLAIQQGDCVELISSESIPYLSDNWMRNTAGIVDYELTLKQFENLSSTTSLVVVRQQSNRESGTYPECDTDDDKLYNVFLNEAMYYIRPEGFYRAQLEFGETAEIPFYVTHLGKPADNVAVNVFLIDNGYGTVLPVNGVTVDDTDNVTKSTNSSGIVSFTYRVAKEMSTERNYTISPCYGNQPNVTTIPIDGQVYQFSYSVCITETNCILQDEMIAIKGLSSSTGSEPYTWERDIYPIFRQFYHLYPVMSGILNLSDYNSVTQYNNLNLLLYAMSLDFTDANYMPVTRDISPSKQNMIINWITENLNEMNYDGANIFISSFDSVGLDNVYDHTPELVPYPNCSADNTLIERNYPSCGNVFRYGMYENFNLVLDSMNNVQNCTRPLFGYRINSQFSQNACNIANLQLQLQDAIEIEFATIPLYLTTLYSIADGCNVEIYNLLRSVVIQEMLHLVQAANILIATGGRPIVDNPNVVPNYPRLGLPGCVHPGLYIYLDKLNISYIHDVFTVIEAPNITVVGTTQPQLSNHTIGQFYSEISDCITFLGDSIFIPENEDLQVSWPWPLMENSTVGQVYIVTNTSTAKDGINEIIEQGEGADLVDPDDAETGQLAHYYRFQEIVCGKELVNLGDGQYSYSGDDVSFDPNGVWPMRPNISSAGIFPETNCYTEAMAFHKVYRALLRDLQITFDGEPKNIFKVVELMESLLVHAKRVMRVKYDQDYTCGPVWDYEFAEVVEVEEEFEREDSSSATVWYYYVAGAVFIALVIGVLVFIAIFCGCYFLKKKAKPSGHNTIPLETLQKPT